ncbi:acyltransferase family protein [Bacillus sp. AK128]
MSTRLKTIDIVRGITILLVVGGHVGIPFNSFFASFRMPLFFIVSGYLFSSTKYGNNVLGLIKSRFWTLLVPYFTTGITALFFLFLLQYIGRDGPDISDNLIGIILSNGLEVGTLPNGPIWFLTCLFCSLIIFCLMISMLGNSNNIFQVMIFLILGGAGYIISRYIHLPWSMDIALIVQPFLYIGYKLKQLELLRNKMNLISVIFLLSIFICSYYFNGFVSMFAREYHNIWLFYLGGISGSLLVLEGCKYLSKLNLVNRLLTYIGKESLSILTLHFVFAHTTFTIAYELLFGHFPNWYINSFFIITICLLANSLIKKIPTLNMLFNGIRLEKRGRNSNVQKAS